MGCQTRAGSPTTEQPGAAAPPERWGPGGKPRLCPRLDPSSSSDTGAPGAAVSEAGRALSGLRRRDWAAGAASPPCTPERLSSCAEGGRREDEGRQEVWGRRVEVRSEAGAGPQKACPGLMCGGGSVWGGKPGRSCTERPPFRAAPSALKRPVLSAARGPGGRRRVHRAPLDTAGRPCVALLLRLLCRARQLRLRHIQWLPAVLSDVHTKHGKRVKLAKTLR